MAGRDMLLSVVIQAVDKTASAFDAASARIGKVEGHLKDVGTAQDGFNKSWERTRGVLNTAANAAGIAGAMIVGSLGAVAGIAIRAGADIAESATKMGLSVEEYTKLKFAAEQSGTSVQTLAMGMGRLSRAAQEANQNGGASAEAFKALGVEVTDSSGQLKGQHELLLDVADAMSKVENPTERSALAMQLMGRGGRQLLPLLMEGSEGIKRMEEQAKKLGLVLTGHTAKSLDAAADKIDGAKSSLQMTAIVVGATVLPALATLATTVAQTVVPFRNWAEENPDLAAGLLAVVGAAGGTLLVLAGLTKTVLFLTESKAALALVTAALEKSELKAAAAAAWATVANTALGRALVAVAAAASVAWKALLGPLGWIIAALTLVGGIVLSISRHYRAKAAAANEAATADKGVAAAAEEATDAQEEEAKKVRDAAKAYRDAVTAKRDSLEALKDAERDYGRTIRDNARSAEKASQAIKDAKLAETEAVQKANEQIDQADRAATQAKQAVIDAVRKMQEDDLSTERKITDAKRALAGERVASLDDERDAQERLTEAKDRAAEQVKSAEDRARQEIARAQERVARLKEQAALERMSPEERQAYEAAKRVKELADAERELQQLRAQGVNTPEVIKARAEAEKAVQKAQEEYTQAAEARAKRVQDAEEAVRAAVAERQKTQTDGEKAIAAALEASADAQKRLQDARDEATKAATEAAKRVHEAELAQADDTEQASDRIVAAYRRRRAAREADFKATEALEEKKAEVVPLEAGQRQSTKARDEARRKRLEETPPAPTPAYTPKPGRTPPSMTPEDVQGTKGGLARFLQMFLGGPGAEYARIRRLRQQASDQQRAGGEAFGQPAPGSWVPRASGGPVSAGMAYTVGERGPELFVPRTGGQIVPNGMMAATAGGPLQIALRVDLGLDDGILVTRGARVVEGLNGRDAIVRLIDSRLTRKGL